MHLFNSKEYEDYSQRVYLNTKKNLESTIQLEVQRTKQPVESDSQQLYQHLTSAGELAFYYEGVTTPLPNSLLKIDIAELLKFSYSSFTEEEKQSLLNYLPEKDQSIIQLLLNGQNFKFGNPIKQFDTQLKSGNFTKLKQKEQQLTDVLQQRYKLQNLKELLHDIKESRKDFKGRRNFYIPDLSEVSSLQQIAPSHDFESASQDTQTEQMLQDENEKQEFQIHQVFFKYQDKRKTQEELIAMSDDRGGQYRTSKIVKPMLVQTKIVRSQDWVQIYRKQEEERYKVPTKPFTYLCQDGTKVTVAPVAKKVVAGVGKPREHIMLKNQRPSCVTILTLVRDSAARLPGGVGTRADICQLLKQSQYVNQDIGDQKINTIVSGALDRLHYMTDACVKYDSEKKLWQYLHLERTGGVHDEDADEYKQKKVYKKKKVEEPNYNDDM